jgi:hypothetical protein
MKISIDVLVPDYLVSLLIGKNGEIIRSMMNKSGSLIIFQKEVSFNYPSIMMNRKLIPPKGYWDVFAP